MDERRAALSRWLVTQCGLSDGALVPASGDASFRRYFRVDGDGQSFIAVDAPPQQEDSHPFVDISRRLVAWGLNAPRVLEVDFDEGFLLLSDLGTRLYLDELDESSVERLYGDALGALSVMQVHGWEAADAIPPYDEALLRAEMALFDEWYLGCHLSRSLSPTQRVVLETLQHRLVENALEQPRVFVHRDYHSRNLMLTEFNSPGILDFQDAVWGPVTYDLVSLLRDCYIEWPQHRVTNWALGYLELAGQMGVIVTGDEERFLRWFDFMGVQRHLKATGIFARLNHRDGKPGYLNDIPRTLGYVDSVCARYPELEEFRGLLHDLGVLPIHRRLECEPS